MARQSRKWKRKILDKIPQKVIPAPTTNLPSSSSTDITHDPEETDPEKIKFTFLQRRSADQTKVPAIGEEVSEGEPLVTVGTAESYPALLDKYILRKVQLTRPTFIHLIIMGWAILLAWLFVQDNGSGKLDNLDGLQWFLVKALVISIIPIILIILIFISGIVAFLRKILGNLLRKLGSFRKKEQGIISIKR